MSSYQTEKEEKKIFDVGVKKAKPFTKKSITERIC